MLHPTHRKTILIFSLALSLATALVALAVQDELREKLGSVYYVLGLSIIGCVLLLLAGYAWDRSLIERIRSLRQSGLEVHDPGAEPDEEAGEQDEVMGLARNIERMARTLQRTEADYRNIVEDQVDLICRYRPDGRLTFVNGSYVRAFGRKRPDLLGTPFPFFTPSPAGSGDGPVTFERELVLPDGRRTFVLWLQRPIKDSVGIFEFQAVGHDITDRKDAEAALIRAKEAAESADRAKSEFLAIVSHELRTPINGVIGFAKLLAESPLTAEQREYVAMIQTGGNALGKLIADILDLSKIEAGRTEIENNPFALHRCIAEVCDSFAAKARETALSLESEIESGVPAIINGDEIRLRQILNNLIGNALKFTDRGRVTLAVGCARGKPLNPGGTRIAIRLFFAITDTGIGIPPGKIGDLFRPFNQVDSSSQRRYGGTGLGLVISKRLCEVMGGTISVESRLGEGTTVRFSVLADYEVGDTVAPFMLDARP